MRKRHLIPAAAGLLLLGAACSPGNNFRDLEGVRSTEPDATRLVTNLDGHPNIMRVCVDGVAFATTTREFTSVMRVPEWDAICPKR